MRGYLFSQPRARRGPGSLHRLGGYPERGGGLFQRKARKVAHFDHLRRAGVPRFQTVEGFVGGILSATLIGAALWWATPFKPLQAAGMALAITLMGFAGGLVMSAIKRDRGVKDYGSLIEGHGGVMDRIDSICFAAPVFYHVSRQLFRLP